jgi:hypothetical protein
MRQNSIKRENLKALMDKLNQASKFASESNEPKDPDETQPQEPCPKSTVEPTGGVNPKEQLEPKETNAAQPAEVKPENGGTGLEEEEKNVVAKAANVTKKLLDFAKVQPKQAQPAEKTAASSEDDLVKNIVMSYDIMSKVAHVLTETEEGRIALQHAIDSEKGKQMQLATLNEIKYASEQVQALEELKFAAQREAEMVKHASLGILSAIRKLPEKEQKKQFKIASKYLRAQEIHRQNMEQFGDNEALKYAYAQGAADAQAINDTAAVEGADPTVEGLDAFGTALDEMIASNEITPEQAQMLAQMAVQAAQTDNNEELSPEEAQMFLEQAIQQGLVDPKVAEAIMLSIMGGEGAAPAPEVPAAAATPADTAVADQTVAEPVEKQASEKVRSIAEKYIKLAYATKVAEEGSAEVMLSPADVAAEIDLAVTAGELDPDLAEKIKAVIETAAAENSADVPCQEKEVQVIENKDDDKEDDDEDDDDDDEDDFDEKEIIEESIKEASEIVK